MFVLDFSIEAQRDFLFWVASGAIKVVEPENADLLRTAALMFKHSDLPMDFTDGLLVAICERLDIKNVVSIDRDFSIYRFKGRGRFRDVFFDH